jgi:hypothetical protein
MYLALHHDGQSWLIIDDQGKIVVRMIKSPSTKASGRSGGPWHPNRQIRRPCPSGNDLRRRRKAKPCPSVFHNGQGWIITDTEGVVIMPNNEIPPDGDYTV